jgi:hypothetical protein
MSRDLIPFFADDMSAFARALRGEIARYSEEPGHRPDQAPGHVQMLNMLARAAGYRNFQHFRAQSDARDRLDHPRPAPVAAPVDYVQVERIARYFDTSGQLVRWPGKHSHRLMCLWVLWSRIEAKRVHSEPEINRALNAQHAFGDHALLRRELCDLGMVRRTPDGREYRRVEQAPPPDAVALIRHLGLRRTA